MRRFESPDDLIGAAPCDLGSTDVISFSQQTVDTFASVTGDAQWIHTDPLRAADGPFGGTIVHGYLTLALASWAVSSTLTVGSSSTGVNYGLDRVRFPRPLPVGAPVRATVTLSTAQKVDDWVHCTLEITMESPDGGKPYCVARKLARFSRT